MNRSIARRLAVLERRQQKPARFIEIAYVKDWHDDRSEVVETKRLPIGRPAEWKQP